MKEAFFYEKLPHAEILCRLCPHFCRIAADEQGYCLSRRNIDGTLYAKNYEHTVSIHTDPIEKKPLYHFYPGEKILSLGANSCNLNCLFCQNFEISRFSTPTFKITGNRILALCRQENLKMVAFTYTEPFTWYEFVWETANLLQINGIKTVLVTNGYVNPEPLQKMLPVIDALNIDLKSFSERFYSEICAGKLQPVLNTIETCVTRNKHVEITFLLIPGKNDNLPDFTRLVDFLYSLNCNIPLHISRYFPYYKFTAPPTSPKIMHVFKQEAEKKMRYVYLGNLGYESITYCPSCQQAVILRHVIADIKLQKGKCSQCGEVIYGCFAQ